MVSSAKQIIWVRLSFCVYEMTLVSGKLVNLGAGECESRTGTE